VTPEKSKCCLIIYDSWDYEDYPLYVYSKGELEEKIKLYENTEGSIERSMEIYDLNKDIYEQLD